MTGVSSIIRYNVSSHPPRSLRDKWSLAYKTRTYPLTNPSVFRELSRESKDMRPIEK